MQRNMIYLELLGNAILFSVNYERTLAQSGLLRGALRVGAGLTPSTSESYGGGVLIPIEPILLIGKDVSFEVSMGITLEYYTTNLGRKTRVTPLPRIGLRYQKPGDPFMLRLGITVDQVDALRVLPWPAVAIGVAF
jgi:hypothetical protein